MKPLLLATAFTLLLVGVADAGHPNGGAVRPICIDDVHRLCPNLRGHELGQCIRQRAAELSDPCKAALSAAHMKPKRLKDGG